MLGLLATVQTPWIGLCIFAKEEGLDYCDYTCTAFAVSLLRVFALKSAHIDI